MGAKHGDTVLVHYVGLLSDGTVFDATDEDSPATLTLGSGQLIAGFESAIEGMVPGAFAIENIPSRLAFGPVDQDKIFEIDLRELDDCASLHPGDRLELSAPDGQVIPATVKKIRANKAVVDANHPLAGHDLTFEIKLLDII